MQLISNGVRVMLVAILILSLGSVPHTFISAQAEQTQDTVLKKAKEVIERIDKVEKKVGSTANIIDSNNVKAKQIVSLIDKLSDKTKTKEAPAKPRVVYVQAKKKLQDTQQAKEPVKNDSVLTQPQYVDRPIIIQPATKIYGKDTFRTNMWKAPNEDGLFKQLFKKKKRKQL